MPAVISNPSQGLLVVQGNVISWQRAFNHELSHHVLAIIIIIIIDHLRMQPEGCGAAI